MAGIHLFELAARQSAWLTSRETLLSGNIANINTPGYRTRDLPAFADVLSQPGLEMSRTNAAHLAPAGGAAYADRAVYPTSTEASLTGNNVDLETELMKAGSTTRAYSLNSALKKAFHQMITAASK
jgi:flagellar basal-body rod protein FlgB